MLPYPAVIYTKGFSSRCASRPTNLKGHAGSVPVGVMYIAQSDVQALTRPVSGHNVPVISIPLFYLRDIKARRRFADPSHKGLASYLHAGGLPLVELRLPGKR